MSSIAAELLMVSGNALDAESECEIARLEKALAAAKLKKARAGEEQPQQMPISKRPVEPDGWAAIEHGKVAAVVASFQSGTTSSRESGSNAAPSTPQTGSELGVESSRHGGSSGSGGPLCKMGEAAATERGQEGRWQQQL